ncbi:hypothetical protein [Nocardioides ferulae]|uniref:hypothetical protein n=1 Tax=Nocardioides ferulae TaxID=2340821 RepID=UPI000EAF68DF|nr:hypothetical protein [Nocardioides ferulae]
MLKLLLVVIVIAVAVYLAVRMFQGELPGRGQASRGPGRPPAPPRPIGPDDDDDFLRDLDRKRRHPEDPET